MTFFNQNVLFLNKMFNSSKTFREKENVLHTLTIFKKDFDGHPEKNTLIFRFELIFIFFSVIFLKLLHTINGRFALFFVTLSILL